MATEPSLGQPTGQGPQQGQMETPRACLCTAPVGGVGQEFILPEASRTFINPRKSAAIPLKVLRGRGPPEWCLLLPSAGLGVGVAPHVMDRRGGMAGLRRPNSWVDWRSPTVLLRPLSVPVVGLAGGRLS